MKQAKIIGITGGSGSGKTTIVKKIAEMTNDFAFISQDNYYKSATYVSNENINAFNFDQPDAFDNDLLYEQLFALKNMNAINMPTYDFVLNSRADKVIYVEPKNLIVFEGIMIFTNERIRNLIDLKIFVDTPSDIRFIRRLKRDVKKRGRTVESVIEQYYQAVRPGHFQFVEPTKNYADIIIPEGGQNKNAMSVLLCFVDNIIQGRI